MYIHLKKSPLNSSNHLDLYKICFTCFGTKTFKFRLELLYKNSFLSKDNFRNCQQQQGQTYLAFLQPQDTLKDFEVFEAELDFGTFVNDIT